MVDIISKAKQGLAACSGEVNCSKCPYNGSADPDGDTTCADLMMRDALRVLDALTEILKNTKKPKQREKRKKPLVVMMSMDFAELRKFKTITEAGRFVGRDGSQIRKACRGECKTAGGYRWKYEEARENG